MASEVAKRLRDRRLNVWNDCKKLAEDAAGEQRSMTPEEQGRWDAMQEEMETLDKRIKSVLDTEKRAKEADEAFDELSGRKPAAGQDQRGGGGHDMQEEIRKFARGEEGAPKFIDVRHQGPGAINYRILTTAGVGGTNASSVIPTDFYDQLIAHLIEVSGIMQCGPTVINTGGGESLQIPKTTAHSYPNANLGTDPASAAQAGNIPTSDPAFSMVTLSAYKFGVLLQVARELIDDTAVDLLGYLAMQAGRAIGNDFGYQLVNGLGTGSRTACSTWPPSALLARPPACPVHRHMPTWSIWNTALSPPTVSHEAVTGWQRTRPSAASARSPTRSAGRSGSRPRFSAHRTCCSASRSSPTRSCRRASPGRRRSASATSASSSCGWSAA